MRISDALNEADLSRLASHTVSIGDVYEMTMTAANGVTPKHGYASRDKYFILLGFNSDGVAYGGVIINSQINRNLPPHLKIYHMPLRQSKYPFLRYDSFVDCLRLKVAYPQKFNEWNYLGKIDEDDLRLIIGTVIESPAESKASLARFGL